MVSQSACTIQYRLQCTTCSSLHRPTQWECSLAEHQLDSAQARIIAHHIFRDGRPSLTMHHIVADGWYIEVLVRELSALYTAFSAGRTSPLLDLPIQYADFALWQRQWLQGEVLENQLAYWKKSLVGMPALLELPTDHRRAVFQPFQAPTPSFP